MSTSVADVDAVAMVQNFLTASSSFQAALAEYPPSGGQDFLPDANSRILGVVRPPYPMIRVQSTPGGTAGDLRRLIAPEVLIEAWSDTDDYPGDHDLNRLCLKALVALQEISDGAWTYGPADNVMSGINVVELPQVVPDPSGQRRAFATVEIFCHAGME